MKQPRLIIDAIREIQEEHEVVRAQAQLSFGTAEVEAALFLHRAFGIFAQVSAPFCVSRCERDLLWIAI